METNKHTLGKLLIDGSYIVGGIFDLGNYEGKEGVIIADFRPSTEYPTPSKDEQLANAERIIDNWNEYDTLIKDAEHYKKMLRNSEIEYQKILKERSLLIEALTEIIDFRSPTRVGMSHTEINMRNKAKELLDNLKP